MQFRQRTTGRLGDLEEGSQVEESDTRRNLIDFSGG